MDHTDFFKWLLKFIHHGDSEITGFENSEQEHGDSEISETQKLRNSEQEHGDSETTGFFEKKCDGGGGDIRQDIRFAMTFLQKEKRKRRAGSLVASVGCLGSCLMFCCKLPYPQGLIFMIYSQLFQMSPGLRLCH